MRKLLLSVLALMLLAALAVAAQEEDAEKARADACVKATTASASWLVPWTLEEALDLRDVLNGIIARCSPTPKLYINSPGAGQVNARSAPELAAEIVANLPHGMAVVVVNEVDGDEFGGSTLWFRLAEGYVHSLLVSESKPPSAAPAQPTSAQPAPVAPAAPPVQISWHDGAPTEGTCKDNVQSGRIFLGCEYDVHSNVHRDLSWLECSHPAFDAFGYAAAQGNEGGSHFRVRDARVTTPCKLHD